MSAHRTDKIGDVELEAERKRRMREQLLAQAEREMAVVRGETRNWCSFLPGVELKLLHVDPEQGCQTALWRMAAGSRIPPHPHSLDEECYLLEGSVEHDGVCYRAGDFMVAPAGSRHGAISSPDGVLMLIRGEHLSAPKRALLQASLALGR